MSAAVAITTWEPLQRFLERSATLFPVLLAVVVVLVAGLLASWTLAALVRWILQSLGFDRIGRRPQVADALRRTSLHQSPSVLVSQVVRWMGVVITLVGALSILNAEATDTAISALVHYLPRLAAGLLLLVIGYAISTFVGRSVLLWAVNARLQGARWLAAGVRLIVGVFFLALVLENLGFGRDIALVVLAILLGGGVLAVALAFGLAGRDIARDSLERMLRETREDDRDTLSHL